MPELSLKTGLTKVRSYMRRRLHLQTRILAKNTFWVLSANIVTQFFFLLRSVFIARSLGVETYGLYATVVSLVSTVQEVFNLNLGTPTIKFGADFKIENRIDKLVALVKAFLLAGMTAACVSVLFVGLVVLFFYDTFIKQPGLAWVIMLFSLASSISFFDFLSISLLKLYFRFKFNALLNMVMDFIEFGVVVLVILWKPGDLVAFFAAVILSRFLNSFLCTAAVFWELRSELRPHARAALRLIKDRWKEIVKFTINNSLSRTVFTLMNRGDVLLLAALAGPVQVAYYNLGKRLTGAILILTNPLVGAMYPQLSLLVSQKMHQETRKLLMQITRLALYPGLMFLVAAIFLKEWLIVFLYGRDFLGAALPFLYLLLSAVLSAIFCWNLSMIQALGLVGLRLRTYLLSLAIGLALALWLIPRWGASGVALALLASTVTTIVVFTLVSWKRLRTENV